MVHSRTCESTLRCYGGVWCLRARLLGQQRLPRRGQEVPRLCQEKEPSRQQRHRFLEGERTSRICSLPWTAWHRHGIFNRLGCGRLTRSTQSRPGAHKVPSALDTRLARGHHPEGPLPDKDILEADRLGLDHYGGEIVTVPIPGTAGGFVGEGNRFRDKFDESADNEH